jgi:phosphoribosyl-AMP cyclohydrolase
MMNFFKSIENAKTGTSFDIHEVLPQLQWNQDGLIPAIVQNIQSKEVQMMAWMNQEALLSTLQTKDIWFWSRSRQKLWRKGETSGHTQKLIEARADCDGDTLLLLVEQKGPACHTNRPHCFYHRIDEKMLVVAESPIQTV